MKKLNFILAFAVLAMAFNFSSCKKETEVEGYPLVGTWKYSSYAVEIETNNEVMTALIKTMLAQSGSQVEIEDNSTMTFNSDGTYVFKANGVADEVGTYKTENDKLIATTANGESIILDYKIKGNTLTIYNANGYLTEIINTLIIESFPEVTITKFALAVYFDKQ